MKRLKPHQIGIVLALIVAAAFVGLNIWGQSSGVEVERARRAAEAAR